MGRPRPLERSIGPHCGQSAACRHQQELSLLGGPAAGSLDLVDRVICLGERVAGQSGGQQHTAPVKAKVGRRHLT
jgi:hypothetical protein